MFAGPRYKAQPYEEKKAMFERVEKDKWYLVRVEGFPNFRERIEVK